jgi:hypothetical protein
LSFIPKQNLEGLRLLSENIEKPHKPMGFFSAQGFWIYGQNQGDSRVEKWNRSFIMGDLFSLLVH